MIKDTHVEETIEEQPNDATEGAGLKVDEDSVSSESIEEGSFDENATDEDDEASMDAVIEDDEISMGPVSDEEIAIGDASEGEENATEDTAREYENNKPEMTDEELDRIADITIETLRGILAFFDAEDSSIDEYEGDEAELILDVVGDDLAVLIGRYGKTLDALQYLVASIVNKKIGYHYPIAVDIEGYRNRRRQKLEALAKSAAARCIRNKKEVRLNPMTPYERRIIHIILREEKRVKTVSEGVDPKRQVVIKPR